MLEHQQADSRPSGTDQLADHVALRQSGRDRRVSGHQAAYVLRGADNDPAADVTEVDPLHQGVVGPPGHRVNDMDEVKPAARQLGFRRRPRQRCVDGLVSHSHHDRARILTHATLPRPRPEPVPFGDTSPAVPPVLSAASTQVRAERPSSTLPGGACIDLSKS